MIILINKYKKIVLAIIIALAFFLRFYQLSSNPPSLNWDEASIGYNAYSILHTGNDEYGNFLPLSIRSFDDYKPPVYIYLAVPSVAIFGLTEFGVRFPAAFFGTLAVLMMYLFVKEILRTQNQTIREPIALLSAFFLAVSPWHLQFSRAAYEGNVGLFFILTATYFFFVSLRKKYLLILSLLFFVVSFYSYHSFRLIIPIYLLGLLILFHKELIKQKAITVISVLLFLVFTFPVFLSFTQPVGSQARLSMVSIFGESDGLQENLKNLQIDKENKNIIGEIVNNRRFFFAREAIKGYFDHFNPNFLFISGAGSFHHHAYNFGMMYLWDLPFLLTGIYYLLKKRNKYVFTAFFLLLIAPLPAAITTGTPHGVRAIAMIPILIFFVSAGFYAIALNIWRIKRRGLSIIILSGVIMFFILNFVVYLNQYYIETPRIYGYFWGAGNKEAIFEAKKIENSYDKIVMTYRYDQPYIYYLFYNKVDPAWYQNYWKTKGFKESERFQKIVGKYIFRNINYSEDKNLKNALLIGTPDEISQSNLLEVRFPDSRIAYRFFSTK